MCSDCPHVPTLQDRTLRAPAVDWELAAYLALDAMQAELLRAARCRAFGSSREPEVRSIDPPPARRRRSAIRFAPKTDTGKQRSVDYVPAMPQSTWLTVMPARATAGPKTSAVCEPAASWSSGFDATVARPSEKITLAGARLYSTALSGWAACYRS